MQYVWFIWSLILLALWAVIYVSKKRVRKEMLFAFAFGMYWFGLHEYLYWRKLIQKEIIITLKN